MKKFILCIFVSLFIAFIPNVSAIEVPEVTDHEVVTIYLFYMQDCSHCHAFIEYFSEIYLDYTDYFEIKTIQVTSTNNGGYLYGLVVDELDEDESGVPLIVIGDSYYKFGFGSDGTEIIEAALDAYQDSDYTDLVQKVIDDNDVDVTAKSFLNACSVTGISCEGEEESSSGLSDGVIIAIIFGVVILGFGALVMASRRD